MKCKICKKQKSSFQPFIDEAGGQLHINVCIDCYKKQKNTKTFTDVLDNFFRGF